MPVINCFCICYTNLKVYPKCISSILHFPLNCTTHSILQTNNEIPLVSKAICDVRRMRATI